MSSRFPHYERLLALYPTTYRRKYGRQMIQTLTDMLDDTQTPAQRRLIWAKVAVDFPISVAKTQAQYIGGTMHTETPTYIKETGLIAGILVLPFCAALAANGLDKVINDRTLYHSWLWHMPVLGIWVLWAPAVALLLATATYARYRAKPAAASKRSRHEPSFDVMRTWPVLLPGVFAFSILCMLAFHDSAHCWVQNPVSSVTRFHQTWQCTKQGFLGG